MEGRLSADTGAGERFARDFARAEAFLKPFYFYAPIFLKMVFCMGPERGQVRGSRIAKIQGVGVGLKTKLPCLLGTVGTD